MNVPASLLFVFLNERDLCHGGVWASACPAPLMLKQIELFQPNSALESQQLPQLSQKEILSPEQAFRIIEWLGLEVISKVI